MFDYFFNMYRFFHKHGYREEYLDLRIQEEKRIIICSAIFFISLMGFAYILIYTELLQPYADNVAVTLIINPFFKQVSEIYQHNDIVESIATVCSNFEEERKQIDCVNNFVQEFFYYDNHPNETKSIRYPKEIINIGGCCRDWTVFYDSIFSVMGYKTGYVNEPNHIYLKLYGKESYYYIDQGWIDEYEYDK